MECRLCTFLIFCILTFSSSITFAQCGNEEYINWMGDVINKKKQKVGGIASLIPTSLALGQAILETGYGKSYSAKKRNNHFGLSFKNRLLHFDSPEKSVVFYLETLKNKQYYSRFQSFLRKGITDNSTLLRVLAPVYADDKGYVVKVSQIIDKCNLERFDNYI